MVTLINRALKKYNVQKNLFAERSHGCQSKRSKRTEIEDS
jgi:hypothetical protein